MPVYWSSALWVTLLQLDAHRQSAKRTEGREKARTIQIEKEWQLERERERRNEGGREGGRVWTTEITLSRCSEPNKGSFQSTMRTHCSSTCCKIYKIGKKRSTAEAGAYIVFRYQNMHQGASLLPVNKRMSWEWKVLRSQLWTLTIHELC